MIEKNRKIIKNNKKSTAFTLVEVLVALFIFSILAILTMRGLQTTFSAKQRAQEALDVLAELQTSYNIIQQDIEQIINRNVREPSGGIKLSFLVPIDNKASSGLKAGSKSESGYNRLEFTRTGINNSIIKQKVSDLQRVAYYQNGNTLIRHGWRQLDPTKDTAVDKRRLLTNLENLNIVFVDQYGRKSSAWQIKPSSNPVNTGQPSLELPRGIILNFRIKNYGDTEWVFTLPSVLNRSA